MPDLLATATRLVLPSRTCMQDRAWPLGETHLFSWTSSHLASNSPRPGTPGVSMMRCPFCPSPARRVSTNNLPQLAPLSLAQHPSPNIPGPTSSPSRQARSVTLLQPPSCLPAAYLQPPWSAPRASLLSPCARARNLTDDQDSAPPTHTHTPPDLNSNLPTPT